jgi:hypothetical protein
MKERFKASPRMQERIYRHRDRRERKPANTLRCMLYFLLARNFIFAAVCGFEAAYIKR